MNLGSLPSLGHLLLQKPNKTYCIKMMEVIPPLPMMHQSSHLLAARVPFFCLYLKGKKIRILFLFFFSSIISLTLSFRVARSILQRLGDDTAERQEYEPYSWPSSWLLLPFKPHSQNVAVELLCWGGTREQLRTRCSPARLQQVSPCFDTGWELTVMQVWYKQGHSFSTFFYMSPDIIPTPGNI